MSNDRIAAFLNVAGNGEQRYIRNFSVERTVVYQAMKRLPFLEKFSGILVHDHETARYHFGTEHGECNVHLIHYLKKNTEETGHKWSAQMISLLCRMNQEEKAQIGQCARAFPSEAVSAFEKDYEKINIPGTGRKQENEASLCLKGRKGALEPSGKVPP